MATIGERVYTIREAGAHWGVKSYTAAMKIVRRHNVQTFVQHGAKCMTESELKRAAVARANWKGRGPRPRQPATKAA